MSTTAEKLTLIADNEQKVYDAGKTQGYTEGKSAGYQNAKSEIEEVTVTPSLEAQEILPTEPNLISKVTVESGQALYDEGKQAQLDSWWASYLEIYSQNGGQTKRIFGSRGWNDETFKPPVGCEIWCINAEGFFQEAQISDIKKIMDERNLHFYFSACPYFDYFAYYCISSSLPTINMSSAQYVGNAFVGCTRLTDISFSGVIPLTISFAQSPLTKDSITSIIEHLSTTATGRTLTLKKTAVNTAFGINVNDETTYPAGSEFYELRHSKDNWTFSYV